jgi:hypothetical protein
MSRAKNYAEKLVAIYDEMQKDYNEMIDNLSRFDREEQDLLHDIENIETFDLYKGWQYCKALHDVRIDRRNNKNEIQVAKILIDNVQPKTILPKLQKLNIDINKEESKLKYITENKVYKPRSK